MKILFLILFFYTAVFGSNFEASYKSLNHEIEIISHKLTVAQKVSLYYLTLATHDKILSLQTNKQTTSEAFKATKKRTLLALEELKNNKKLKKDEIIQLRSFYANMNHAAKEMLLQTQKKPNSMEITYKEIDKKPYVKTILFAFTIFLLFISSVLGYLLYQSKNTNTSKDGFLMINEIKAQKMQLSEQVIELQTKLDKQNLEQEEHQNKNLVNTQEEALKSEIQKLKKHIQTLQQELLSQEYKS